MKKARQKKVLAISVILGGLALVASLGTWAYFTYTTEPRENEFKIGSIKAQLLESPFSRSDNSDDVAADGKRKDDSIEADDTTYNVNPYIPPTGTNQDKWCLTNTEATCYEAPTNTDAFSFYLYRNAQNIVPGQEIKKAAYIKNTGKNDAWVRLAVYVPMDDFNKYQIAINSDAVGADADNKEFVGDTTLTVCNASTKIVAQFGNDAQDTDYCKYTFMTREMLPAGDMTLRSPIVGFKLKGNLNQNVTNPHANDLAGKITAESTKQIVYQVEAIQADQNTSTDRNSKWTTFANQYEAGNKEQK